MTDPAPDPPTEPADPVSLPFELEHWYRPREADGRRGPERVFARTLLPDRDLAIRRLAYLRRLTMDPDRLPPPGLPRASRLRLVERRVLEEAVLQVPDDQPLIRYKQGWQHHGGGDPAAVPALPPLPEQAAADAAD